MRELNMDDIEKVSGAGAGGDFAAGAGLILGGTALIVGSPVISGVLIAGAAISGIVVFIDTIGAFDRLSADPQNTNAGDS